MTTDVPALRERLQADVVHAEDNQNTSKANYCFQNGLQENGGEQRAASGMCKWSLGGTSAFIHGVGLFGMGSVVGV